MAKKQAEPEDFESLLSSINEQLGEDIMTVCEGGKSANVYAFPTDIPAIDISTGVGGIPEGRIIEIYGAESSGKTTISLTVIAACQRHFFPHKNRYGRTCIIDAEHALDIKWAKNIGVDTTKLAISQPDSGEIALRMTEKLVKTGMIDLIVVDSVAALTPQAEIDGEVGDQHVGAQARLMSQACRKLVSLASTHKTTIIFINQLREKIGIKFGNPETTPGGRALRFYSSIRCEVIKGSANKLNDTVIGFRPKIKFVKNKVAPPFTTAEFDICTGTALYPVYGIDSIGSLIESSERYKLITKAGSHYNYGNIKLGNGLVNAAKMLRTTPDIADKLRKELYSIALHKDTNIPDQFETPLEIVDE